MAKPFSAASHASVRGVMIVLKLLDLFSGIGGFSLGLERTGKFETVAFCENETKRHAILKRHWPEVPIYDDAKTLSKNQLEADGIRIDAICGGFPCQDLSLSGKLEGIDAERSGLWSDFARLIGELRPQVVFVENVANLLAGPSEQPGKWFGRVLGDLASFGYDAEWHCIPAASIGAPHHRDRIWIVAYPQRKRRCRGGPEWQHATYADTCGQAIRLGGYEKWWSTEPGVGRLVDGFSGRLDRLKALGNAVVPQIPELLGRAYLANID
jgi:DNA (cytosine-5)-methyltransferase 1